MISFEMSNESDSGSGNHLSEALYKAYLDAEPGTSPKVEVFPSSSSLESLRPTFAGEARASGSRDEAKVASSGSEEMLEAVVLPKGHVLMARSVRGEVVVCHAPTATPDVESSSNEESTTNFHIHHLNVEHPHSLPTAVNPQEVPMMIVHERVDMPILGHKLLFL